MANHATNKIQSGKIGYEEAINLLAEGEELRSLDLGHSTVHHVHVQSQAIVLTISASGESGCLVVG